MEVPNQTATDYDGAALQNLDFLPARFKIINRV